MLEEMLHEKKSNNALSDRLCQISISSTPTPSFTCFSSSFRNDYTFDRNTIKTEVIDLTDASNDNRLNSDNTVSSTESNLISSTDHRGTIINISVSNNGNDSNKQSSQTSIQYTFGSCKICSDKASGIHYGIATCEGCKVRALHLFFLI